MTAIIGKQVTFDVDGRPIGYDRAAARRGRTPASVEAWRRDVVVCYQAAAGTIFPKMGEYTGRVGVALAAYGATADADNLAKEVMDALVGVAYRDDAAVVNLNVTLPTRALSPQGRPRKPKEAARARVTVTFYDALEVA